MDDIIKIQRYFAQKAQNQPNHRFQDMHSLVWKTSFLTRALDHVLSNRGSRSAGVDGITITKFKEPEYRTEFIQRLSHELKNMTFRPQPGRRVYIPKANGKQRPLGILTIQDRVVQMVLKMLMEPIFEMDFLDCSYGFRPQRRTMDCITPIWRHTSATKHYWIVEGDIRACFDAIRQDILMALLRKRIADKKILRLNEMFLKVGVMEGRLFRRTDIGTQQGGILSPLLANVYLHQFDLSWWQKYGRLSRNEKRQRRRNGLGQPLLYRYADDWVLLWSGRKEGAIQLKDEAETFFEQELKLELNTDKTVITHIDDGFSFLGFNIKRYPGTHGKPVVLVQPSQKSVRKFKAKIKSLTSRNTTYQPGWYKVLQLNQILQGWRAHYHHVNAKTTFKKLDWWVLNRVFSWARKKHGNPAWRVVNAKYKHRDPKGRINFVCRLDDGSPIWLYRMADRPIRRYWLHKQQPVYLQDYNTNIEDPPTPFVDHVSYPAKESDQLRIISRNRDNHTCQYCQKRNVQLHTHHKRPKQYGGKDTLDNLTTACVDCHHKIHQMDE